MNRIRIVLTALSLTTACNAAPKAPEPLSVARDTSLPIQTGELHYELRPADGLWEADISYTFTNPTSDSVYVVGCRGPHPPYLERLQDGEWVLGWSADVFGCLDLPPFSIRPNGQHSAILRLIAAFPDMNAGPKFVFDPPDGVYRLVWKPRASFNEGAPDFGPLLPFEQRISNSFELAKSD